MIKICFMLTLIVLVLPLYSKDFNKTEEMINTLLKSQEEREKAPVKVPAVAEKSRQEPVKEEKDEADKKPAGMSSPDEILLKTGIQLYNSDLFDYAEDKFRELARDYPRSPYLDSSRIWLSRISIKKYRYDDAIKGLSAIKSDSGEYPMALYNTGYCHMAKGNEIKSIEFFHRVSSRFPEHQLADNALLNSGEIFFRNGKGNQALESAIKLIKFYSHRETADDAYYLLGKIYEKDPLLKDPEMARTIYKKFLKKADSGDPVFSRSPLKDRVKKDLRYIEKNYFRLKN
jgi:TolA-binding protein